MKICTKILRLIIPAILLTVNLNAQNSNSAIGVRWSNYTYGVTISHSFFANQTWENILNIDHEYKKILLTTLYDDGLKVDGIGGLKFHYGAGAHIGALYTPGKITGQLKQTSIQKPSTTLISGADIILGLSYRYKSFPFVIGADIKPYLDFLNAERVGDDFGISLSYLF